MTADVEYGPGIVQKLTAKFTQLSQEVSSTARYSPHTTRKRFPSVDDILSNSSHNRASTNLVTHRYSGAVGGDLWAAQSTLPKKQQDKGQNICSVSNNSNLEPENLHIWAGFSGAMITSDVRDQMFQRNQAGIPITALKEKFERPSRAKAFVSAKNNAGAVVRRPPRSHSATPRGSVSLTRSYVDENEEPEFIKIHRRLKASVREGYDQNSNHLFTRHITDIKKPINVDKPLDITLPKLSSTARLIQYSPTGPLEAHQNFPSPVSILDLVSPPDPDSARTQPPHLLQPQVSRGGNSNVPSVPHFTRTPSEVYPTQLTKPSISNDDGSGIKEMHQLLSKFSNIREQKTMAENKGECIPEFVLPSSEKPLPKITPKSKVETETKGGFLNNSVTRDSAEMLRTRKSSLVTVPKPRDFLSSNVLPQKAPDTSSIVTQTMSSELSNALPFSSSTSSNITSTRPSVFTVTIDDMSRRPSYLTTEFKGIVIFCLR
ncbi:unnamed protein product [Enterobius vermicularis]|uniref:ULP_PROTEASE domain-containing protein n=1 Tax=Enterobius vermicularis TaxID=51028 RepID=A0A0N4VGR1_ENTVE|nr:unnamed protein product [Enterobius vermicularis]